MSTLIGKVKEKLGWLTADRTEEAKGKLEQADAQGLPSSGATVPSDEDTAAIDAVVEARRQVKQDYGELGPNDGGR